MCFANVCYSLLASNFLLHINRIREESSAGRISIRANRIIAVYHQTIIFKQGISNLLLSAKSGSKLNIGLFKSNDFKIVLSVKRKM